jgi:hypothetical protein
LSSGDECRHVVKECVLVRCNAFDTGSPICINGDGENPEISGIQTVAIKKDTMFIIDVTREE